MNRPTVHFSDDSLRKVGDSNPRYGNPHGSLANCWFQPLTQPSSRKSLPNQQASFSNAGAKILHFFCSTKFFCNFFQEICIFSWFFLFLGGIIGDKLTLSTKKEADLPIIGNLPPVGKGRSMMWWNSECINIWESSAFVIHRLFSLPACCSLCGPPWARECPLGFNSVIWWVSRSNRNDPYSFWHPCIITMQRCKHLSHYLIMQR